MNSLKNKKLLIGKEPSMSGRLYVALVAPSEKPRVAAVGAPGSVPQSVSRCKPMEEVAHASITEDAAGNLIITNLKQQNVTRVDGVDIVSKQITSASKVELGKDRYRLDLTLVLKAAEQLLGNPAPSPSPAPAPSPTPTPSPTPSPAPTPSPSPNPGGAGPYNIHHLEYVWRNYQDGLKALRERQKQVNLVRTGCSIFTMCAMPCIFFLGPAGYVLTAIGIVGTVYSFVAMKNDNTSEQQEQLLEQFQDNYACPNPNCNKFLGNISYKLLKKQYGMHCPYCKSEYVEK